MPEYRFTQHRDVHIAYRIIGTGKPVIVINGGPGRSSYTFTKFAKTLSSYGFQIILFDQRGTGQSKLQNINAKNISIDLMVEDLEALRKALNLNKLSIIGHSFGGMYAMSYAAKYPEHIEHLVLSASGAIKLESMKGINKRIADNLDTSSREKYLHWTSKEQIRKNPLKSKIESLKIAAPAYVINKKHINEVRENLINLQHYSPQINQLVWKDLRKHKYDLSKRFKNVKFKTLIIACENDFLGKSIPKEINKSIRSSKLEFLKDCRHYPWLDRPDEYFKLISQEVY